MRLIIARHGETEWNRQKRTQGITDIELSQKGHRQAKKLGQRVRNMCVKCVYTSPLSRAVSTAAPAASYCRAPIKTDSDLIEIHFGEWEGMTFEEIGETYPEQLALWNETPHRCVPPGEAETLLDVAERVQRFLWRVKEKHERETIMVVSHSVPCKTMVALSIGLPLSRLHTLRMDNASVTIVDYYDEKAVLRVFNDTTHLVEVNSWQKR